MGLPQPHKDLLDAAFLTPNHKALSDDNHNLISAIGNRRDVPEPKRCYLFDGVDDTLELITASVGTLYVSGVLMDGTLDTDIAIGYNTDRYKITKTVNEKVFNIKVWDDDLASDDEKKAYEHESLPSNMHSWLKCDEGIGSICYDSSGNGNDWIISGATLASFHYSGSDVPYSWQNEVGYKNGESIAYDYSNSIDQGVAAILSGSQSGVSLVDNELQSVGTNSGAIALFHPFDFSFNCLVAKVTFTITRYVSGQVNARVYDSANLTTVANQLGQGNSFESGVGTYEKEITIDFALKMEQYTVSSLVISTNSDLDVTLDKVELLGKVPRNEGDKTKDIFGIELLLKGRVRQLLKIKNVNVGNPDGIDDVLLFSDLSGVTITSWSGTSTPSINGNNIEFTAGTIWDLRLSDGTILPFDADSGSIVYDVSGNGNHGAWVGHSEPTQWAKNDDAISHMFVYGYRRNNLRKIYDYINSIGLENTLTISGSDTTGVTKSNNKLLSTGVNGNSVNFIFSPDFKYRCAFVKVTYTITRYVSGLVNVRLLGHTTTVQGTYRSSLGTYTETLEIQYGNLSGAAVMASLLITSNDDLDVTFDKLEITGNVPADLSDPMKDVNGEDLTYRGADFEKNLPSELNLELDFQNHKALHEDVPSDYQEGDSLVNEMLVDDDDTDKIKKIVVASEDIVANQRLKTYTRTT